MSDDENLSIYDEIEIEDMTFDEAMQTYFYPCPCGDKFQIALDDLLDEQDIAVCPSCSLMIRVIFDLVSRRTCLGSDKKTNVAQDDLPKPPTSGPSGGQVSIAA
jgi:diphthamide biosynthesis protein 3